MSEQKDSAGLAAVGNDTGSSTPSAIARHTSGPWRWEVHPRSKEVRLCGGRPHYDLSVMDFVRWGMNSATPRFLRPLSHSMSMILEHVERFTVPIRGREHHEWIRTVDHPDAHLIAAAPELYGCLRGLLALPGVREAAQKSVFGSIVYSAEEAIAKAEGRS